jgi:prepilin-type N-terminal cleavage/methylation domain-containing protein
MRTDHRPLIPSRPQAGFSLIELLIVIIIILLLAAVALPNALAYMRVYKVSGAAQQVAGTIQSARSRAIMRNANSGVAFWIIDSNTYRFRIEDAPILAENEGPLLDLPTNIHFVAGGTAATMCFDRLGRWSQPAGGCPNAAAVNCEPASRCDDAPGNYITNDATGSLIGVTDLTTGIIYQVAVTPDVSTQR